MKISLHQLTVLQAIKHHQGMTAAARALHMTQPGVSNIVKQLEQYYDCKLVEVVGKKVFMTDAGNIVVKMAAQIQHVLDEGSSDLALLKGGVSGTLRVAVVSTAQYFAPRLLGAFKHENPHIHIELNVCNRGQILHRLTQNLDDFVIMSQPPSEHDLTATDFYEDQLVVAAGAGHPLLARKQLSLPDLMHEQWLIRERGSGTRIVMEKLFQQHLIQPDYLMAVGNNESIKQLIIANMGISIVSQQSIELELAGQLIHTLPVVGFPLHHKWYQVSHRHKSQSVLTRAFNDFVAHHANLAHFTGWVKQPA